MARAPSLLLASGFSQITCLPWASASQATSAWNALGTQMSTRSMSSARVISRQSVVLRPHPQPSGQIVGAGGVDVGGGDEVDVTRHVGVGAGDRAVRGAVGAGDVARPDDARPGHDRSTRQPRLLRTDSITAMLRREVVERGAAAGHAVLLDRGEARVADRVEGVEHVDQVDDALAHRAEEAGLDRLPERRAPRRRRGPARSGRMSLKCTWPSRSAWRRIISAGSMRASARWPVSRHRSRSESATSRSISSSNSR